MQLFQGCLDWFGKSTPTAVGERGHAEKQGSFEGGTSCRETNMYVFASQRTVLHAVFFIFAGGEGSGDVETVILPKSLIDYSFM